MSHTARDGMIEEVVETPHVSQNVTLSSTPRTVQHVLAQATSIQVTTQVTPASTTRVQQTPSSSSRSSTSTTPINTTSLCEIYEADTPNSFSLFELFSHIDDPLTFEEALKNKVWVQAIDEEIECIEKNQTWELVDVSKVKDVISVK